MAQQRGALICFEGIDHSGKTTHAKLLVDALNAMGIRATLMRFPDRNTIIGKMINEHLSTNKDLEPHVAHMLFSANRWEKSAEIRSRIANGETVVLDRYSFSGEAYSVAKGLSVHWCICSERGLPHPDATIFFKLSPEQAMERHPVGVRREVYEEVGFLHEVTKAYATIRFYLNSWAGAIPWAEIDATLERDENHEHVLMIAQNTIKSVQSYQLLDFQ